MKHSQPNDPEPDDPTNRRKGRYGCLPIALAIACGLLLAMLALMSGATCFFITRATGPATLATMIVGAVSAAAVVCLASPLGAALYWLLAPGNEHAVTRSVVSLSIAVLVLILHSQIILGGAVIGAIGGAALFRISNPSTASVLGAIGFTLLGVLTGFAAGGPGGDES